MPRTLVLVPADRSLLADVVAIEPGYPKPNTPDDMRRWATDLERVYRSRPGEIEALRRGPPERLTPEQRDTLESHRQLFDPTSRGIRGDLLPDGRVAIEDGRHRAHYIAERGLPVPVWVASPDARRLEAFERECVQELSRQRHSDRAERDAAPGRPTVADAERELPPERHLGPEALERSGDRDVWRGEQAR